MENTFVQISLSDLIKKNLKNHVIVFYYYIDVINQSKIYFNNFDNWKFQNIQVKRPVHTYVPLLFAAFVGVLMFAYLLVDDFNYKTAPIAIAIELLPLYGRIYYLIIILSWSVMVILYQVFVLKKEILYYTLMAVFAVSDDINSKITPNDLSRSLLDIRICSDQNDSF